MHTAICTFQDRDAAERAREQLLRAGFQRNDLHVEHRGSASDTHAGDDPRGWEGTDHEVAVNRDVVDRVAGFFVNLFGQGSPDGHERTYGNAVEAGRYVLVLDAMDQAEAQRAHQVLHGMAAEDLQVVHRPAQRPLRDLLRDSPAHVESPERVQAAFRGRSTDWSDRSEAGRERALASGSLGEQRPLDLRDPDLDHVGLRYADKDADKPQR